MSNDWPISKNLENLNKAYSSIGASSDYRNLSTFQFIRRALQRGKQNILHSLAHKSVFSLALLQSVYWRCVLLNIDYSYSLVILLEWHALSSMHYGGILCFSDSLSIVMLQVYVIGRIFDWFKGVFFMIHFYSGHIEGQLRSIERYF